MKHLTKNFIIVLLIFLTVAGIFALLSYPGQEKKPISLTELVQDINQGKVKEITVSGNDVSILYQNDTEAKSKKETEIAFSQSLLNYGVTKENLQKIKINSEEKGGLLVWLGPTLLLILPLLIFGAFFWMIFRQAKTGAMQAFDFSKARARLFGAEGHPKEKISFRDVAGLAEAKEELKEIVDFLKNPKKFLQMGARIPRGVLLMGPPGTGKTLLARAVAGEANVPFFHISGSEFVEMFVGVGAARVRDLFATAKKAAPSILFIDELDAVGRHRGAGLGGSHDEREQTLNQILVEMDGFERDTNVMVMSATNRPDILDPALLRPGRFDRRVVLDLPDINDREEILKIHVRDKSLAIGVDLREIAERTPGFSGADLANLVNEATLLAARRNKHQVYQEELLESIDKVLLGPERKSHILSEKEKEIAAYHESGHALVAHFLPNTEPIRKISIIARGRAAGYTLKLPAREKYLKSKGEFLSELATFLGGYCAEKLVFGEITTGASSDLQTASELARKLVKEYGMSEKLGPVAFGEKEELIFLGKEIGEQRNYSEKIAAEIDAEITKLIKNAQTTAKKILKEKKRFLVKVAKTLIKKETIEREEFERLVGKLSTNHPNIKS
ncbi:MAG: cell division protein FtsH [Candidatus Nealsonbacteria bacterium CG_4_10_14_0_8_um_filter_37_14]|uniref:ATP-dependent zinc metalloprotease FtsH n=1 Tax=Candidatus Nealsonbacteria bacterium CG_4_10_14_0_8_um_filter_37_14 TaxID=1974684 RepID=A0A2M7R6P1_9BACT|nr:MAG: cell division protein FtsH [Candidatus Nealsonbacteria bacterium CG_4_10_14_0_8_um_filter_37_14]